MIQQATARTVGMHGGVTTHVLRGGQTVDISDNVARVVTPEPAAWPDRLSVRTVLEHAMPQPGLPEHVNRYRRSNARNVWRGARRILAAKALRVPTMFGALYARVLHRLPDGDVAVDEYGLISLRVVTTAGVGYIVDAFQDSAELENMKYHGYGTGTDNEASSDSALATELTDEYATDNTRPTGTTTEGSGANVYRTVATLAPDSGGTIAVTEHGVFSQASNAGGVLLDRSKFSAINLVAGTDSLETTYDLTFDAGS